MKLNIMFKATCYNTGPVDSTTVVQTRLIDKKKSPSVAKGTEHSQPPQLLYT